MLVAAHESSDRPTLLPAQLSTMHLLLALHKAIKVGLETTADLRSVSPCPTAGSRTRTVTLSAEISPLSSLLSRLGRITTTLPLSSPLWTASSHGTLQTRERQPSTNVVVARCTPGFHTLLVQIAVLSILVVSKHQLVPSIIRHRKIRAVPAVSVLLQARPRVLSFHPLRA